MQQIQKNPKLGKGMAALFGQVIDVEQTQIIDIDIVIDIVIVIEKKY
jgi:hypothetical protein